MSVDGTREFGGERWRTGNLGRAKSSNESCDVGHAFLRCAGLEYVGTYHVAEFLRIQLRSTQGVQGCWASVFVRGVAELR